MSGSNLQGFDWENFGAVDRWSFMGGGHLWEEVDCSNNNYAYFLKNSALFYLYFILS